ncbi:MAG: leucyl aminopeptidase family protein [Phycisphaeraceae bacterium]|nr:MAG: leucyl aminopeptidase family protein [Phycisphaeraceae bacterium]
MFESVRIATRGQAGVLVLGVFKDQPLDTSSARLDASGAAAAAVKRPEFSADLGAVTEAFPEGRSAYARVLVVGLGERKSFEPGCLRLAAAAMGRRLAGVKATSAHLRLETSLLPAKPDLSEAGVAFGEGLGLISWTCDEFKGKGTPEPKRTKLTLRVEPGAFADGVDRGLSLADGANIARTLSQTPPNIATPAYIARQAKAIARLNKLRCTIVEGEALRRERLVGHINVGKASENGPCMIRLEYRPAGARGKPLVIIGKTMTYDTGGLSLKVNNGMVGMKRDKDGGCAVLGAMHAIASTVKPRRPVVALLACAENSISDEAYRPDDILTYRNGVTVEVTNTDAEGRLVLADALCWACEKEDPAAVIDLATLTGGVVTALGSTYCGMFCEDDGFRGKVEAAAKASGERVWRLPMHQEYREMMKSPIADILNSNPNRKAHPIQGAAFLSYFVEPGVPWCHLDIAGVHVAERNAGLYTEGPTGWGARLLAHLADSF